MSRNIKDTPLEPPQWLPSTKLEDTSGSISTHYCAVTMAAHTGAHRCIARSLCKHTTTMTLSAMVHSIHWDGTHMFNRAACNVAWWTRPANRVLHSCTLLVAPFKRLSRAMLWHACHMALDPDDSVTIVKEAIRCRMHVHGVQACGSSCQQLAML